MNKILFYLWIGAAFTLYICGLIKVDEVRLLACICCIGFALVFKEE